MYDFKGMTSFDIFPRSLVKIGCSLRWLSMLSPVQSTNMRYLVTGHFADCILQQSQRCHFYVNLFYCQLHLKKKKKNTASNNWKKLNIASNNWSGLYAKSNQIIL